MTKDEIIKLAKEAGLVYWEATAYANELSRFASLVAQQEREKCAKLCDDLDQKLWEDMGEPMSGYGEAIREIT
jgi:hypothetical protein